MNVTLQSIYYQKNKTISYDRVQKLNRMNTDRDDGDESLEC